MYKIIILFKNSEDNKIDTSKSYSLKEAIEIVKALRKNNINAELYPAEYANVQISVDKAWEIAKAEYNKVKSLNPANYGDLQNGSDRPIYYNFYCRDYEKEKSGMIPGYYGIRVDKITGKLVSKQEAMEYYKLNYSF